MIENVKIAVVDDDNMLRDVIVDILMFSVNRDVMSFDSATSAWEQFNKGNSPDILISDVEMPGMSGLELVDKVMLESPEKVCILMSGDPSYEIPAKEMGATAFLAKPFDIKDLFSIVETYVVADN
jgi:two-component system response regulator FlrC